MTCNDIGSTTTSTVALTVQRCAGLGKCQQLLAIHLDAHDRAADAVQNAAHDADRRAALSCPYAQGTAPRGDDDRPGGTGSVEGAQRAGDDRALVTHAAHQVRQAEKARNGNGAGRGQHFRGDADLRDARLQQHHETVRQPCGFVHVVRHQHHGGALAALEEIDDRLSHLGPQLGVERRERLVEQKDGRIGGQCPRQRDAVPLPSTEGGWARATPPVEAARAREVPPRSREPRDRDTPRTSSGNATLSSTLRWGKSDGDWCM